MTGLKAPAGAVTEEAALVPAGECGGHLRTSRPTPLCPNGGFARRLLQPSLNRAQSLYPELIESGLN